MRVLLFGSLSEISGWRERSIDPPPLTLFALRNTLAQEDAALGEALFSPGVLAVVDKQHERGDIDLRSKIEVAFLPPMSGG